jgi:thioredoxin reductase (NADPH)
MLEPILVQGLQPGGQLTITTEVENWPGDSHVQGPDLMVRMEDHARAMGAEIISDYITSP